MRRIFLVVLLCLALAGCSSGGDKATTSTTPTTSASTSTSTSSAQPRPQGTFNMVSLNLLHGLACPPDTNRCLAPDRVTLLARLIEEAHCPEVVALQEMSGQMQDLVNAARPSLCGGRYTFVTDGSRALDTEIVLSRLPTEGQERIRLAGPQRTAFWVRVRAELGPVDVVVTHIGAGADEQGNNGLPCDRNQCPASCKVGSPMVTCQVTQVVGFLNKHRPAGNVGIVTGDFNVVPGSAPYRVLTDADLVDTFAAAGNAPCDPVLGRGCTGGRPDNTVTALQNPASQETERIDFTFLGAGRCRPEYGTATGLFAAAPTSGGPAGLAWPSDHVGTSLDLTCT